MPPSVRFSSRTWSYLLLIIAAACLFYALNPEDYTPYLHQSLQQHLSHFGSDTTSSKLVELFPAAETYDDKVWQDRNARTMHGLMTCMTTNSCRENQTKVLLLGTHHFYVTIEGGLAGENIWCNSIITALEELGYSFLFSKSTEEAVQQYRMMPNLVHSVIIEPRAVSACFADLSCLKSASNPLGIPFWKLFGFHWWNGADGHPLGVRWTISPENYKNGIYYLGYSVEQACRRRSFVPHMERRNQAYILAKRVSYFYKDTYGWEDDWYTEIFAAHGTEFVVGIQNDTNFPSHLPPATRNIGTLNQEKFLAEVARSRVLVGIGQPFLSPSPYDALCLGVPFINGVQTFDRDNPKDQSRWISQHDPIMRLGEPYVYSVVKGDKEGFMQAIKKALSTPIDSYVPAGMTHTAMRERMASFLDFDWRALGREELANRTASGRELYVL